MKSALKESGILRSACYFFILSLIYFSQVHPYVHFHHSHDNQIIPLEISLHPINVDPDRNCAHDGDNHHHHNTFDQSIDWYLLRAARSPSRLVIFAPQLAGEFSFAATEFDDNPQYYVSIDIQEIAPVSITGNMCTPRAPPALG